MFFQSGQVWGQPLRLPKNDKGATKDKGNQR